MHLSFQGMAGATYDIQATPDFQRWTVIGTTSCPTNGVVTYDVSPDLTGPRQFFRLAVR